jgi:hypothetical protein
MAPNQNWMDVAKFRNAMSEMAQGTYKSEGDLIDYTLYDTASLLSTVNEHRMFTVPVGQVDPVTALRKDFGDTNVEGAIGLPTGQKLMVERIKLFYVGAAAKDEADAQAIYGLFNQCVFNFQISGKDTYGRWLLTEMFNLSLGQIILPAATFSASPMTVARSLGVFPLELPIVLASLTTFNVTLQIVGNNADTFDTDRIVVGLNGALGRLS